IMVSGKETSVRSSSKIPANPTSSTVFEREMSKSPLDRVAPIIFLVFATGFRFPRTYPLAERAAKDNTQWPVSSDDGGAEQPLSGLPERTSGSDNSEQFSVLRVCSRRI